MPVYFLTVRFPWRLVNSHSNLPPNEPPPVHEKHGHVFYHTDSQIVAEKLVEIFRSAQPAAAVSNPNRSWPERYVILGVGCEKGGSPFAVFEIVNGADLSEVRRVQYKSAVAALEDARVSGFTLDMDCADDIRRLLLWAQYERSKQLEPLIRGELSVGISASETNDTDAVAAPGRPARKEGGNMTGSELADRIGQFVKDVDKYLIWTSVLQAAVRAGEADDARPQLAGEALAAEKKTLADGRPVAEALDACGGNASSVLTILHHVEAGYGGDGGAAADAIRPFWQQWKIKLQRTAMRLRRGERLSAAEKNTTAPDRAGDKDAPSRPAPNAMSNDSTRKAAALRKVAEALRAWGKLGGTKSLETCDAARNALDLATHHLGIIMAASNEWGCHEPTVQALGWLQKAAAQRGRVDFGGYWCWWQQLTQPHLCGSPVPVGLPDDLERWADELDKAGAVPAPEGPEARLPLTLDAAAARASGGRGTGGGAALASIWQDVQCQLLELVEKGERFTSYGKLAVRFKRAKNTVRKAVRESDKLCAWKDAEAKKSPRAQSLNAVVMDNARSKEPDPSDALPDDEVGTIMARLIQQAETPEKRAALNAMDKNRRQELVRLTLEQDSERRVEEEARCGNKILGRKP